MYYSTLLHYLYEIVTWGQYYKSYFCVIYTFQIMGKSGGQRRQSNMLEQSRNLRTIE
jgi:hypothetical protein